MENKMNMYTAQALANHIASLSMQLGAVSQERDELKEANQILKDQLKQKEGNTSDVTQTDTHDEQAEPKQPKDLPTPE
ncbi:hypothetical protein EFT87_03940 [Schleiferilactobacillus harbinensis]|uniref:hypothetical protein n=1 Tax=Schleiferilactobacillus harbinensis TaxID=304207 RepID=UPI0021A947E1|nr:hypothetical protein [Schleiferilactobacillus harbinensis]MCT2907812.1 hypothetical protein [Schleiferilactobacillus harbinensis]